MLLTPWSHHIPPEGEEFPGGGGRHGRGGYQIMLRSLIDPERSPRGTRPKGDGHLKECARMAKSDPLAWREVVLGVMADGQPRTFNAIGVLAMDKTADILGGSPFEECVWQLVAARELEACTTTAPGAGIILFRLSGTRR